LDRSYLGEYFFAGDTPVDTGFKYHRITGGEDKALYRPWQAMLLAREHARLFIANREATILSLAPEMDSQSPSILCPYDAELFGHWWFEGPQFIEGLFERAAASSSLEMASTDAMKPDSGDTEMHNPIFSSWGEGGFGSVWINSEVDWIYPLGYQMVVRFRECRAAKSLSRIQKRILAQMAREIALFQASDWAFMIHNHSAENFAKGQLHEYSENFTRLYESFFAGADGDREFLLKLEEKHNIFPWMNESLYCFL
jgi:1,4-alpha-glucan branching enzyme